MDITALIREVFPFVIRAGVGAVLFLILIYMIMFVVDRAYDKTDQATRKSRTSILCASVWISFGK